MAEQESTVRRPGKALQVVDDLWNPILVKEVRQALRGRYFRVCFVLTLVAVTIVACAFIVAMGSHSVSEREANDFFMAIFTCLCIAVLGLVPFWAFNAMGGEWEENTFDLLIISNLSPRQIVGGKMLAAGVQALLYFSAFAPFLIFSFLLRSIDLVVVGVILGGVMLVSFGLSALALMLSTLSRVRFARVVLMAALAGALVGAVAISFEIAEELMRNPAELHTSDARFALIFFSLAVGLVAAFCFATTCNMLAHAEENRSSAVRILTTAALLALIGFIGYTFYAGTGPPREFLSGFCVAVVVALLVPSTFFSTESEALGRRAALRVPKNPILAAAITPWLPGGGRGLLLTLIHLALVFCATVVGHLALKTPGQSLWDEGLPAAPAAILYALIYLGLPSALLAPFTVSPVYRAAVRVLIPFLVFVFAAVPALLGFFLEDDGLMDMEHPGNPFYLFEQCFRDRGFDYIGVWTFLAILAGLALVLNLKRIVLGVIEVQQASSNRTEIERRAKLDTSLSEATEDAVAEA